jgi:hypothetical protein
MRRAHLVLPLATAFASLLACQTSDDPSAAPDPVSPATPAPSLGATNIKIVQPFFLIFDDVPSRNYTVTFGLVSPVSDLPDCGGSGPVITDGGGITRVLITPSGAFHIRDQLNQATIVFYEGATGDVCELSSHRILGTGTGSMHFTTKEKASGTLAVQATFGGILDLVGGGRAHMLGVGNIAFDALGNLIVHEDHFTFRRIGR